MKILIVEDHPIVISGFRALMAAAGDTEVVEARNAMAGLEAFSREDPALSVIDINLPDQSGFEVARKISALNPCAKMLIFTMSDAPILAAKAVEMGARGFVSKDDDPMLMLKAVHAVVRGELWLPDEIVQELALLNVGVGSMPTLTDRELEVLRLLAKGQSMSEIAEVTEVSYKTIATDCASLREKLKARTSTELVRLAMEQKII